MNTPSAPASSSAPPTSGARLAWIDISKGISILLIAYFHFFSAFDNGRYPWPFRPSSFPAFLEQCSPQSPLQTLGCILEGCLAMLFQLGPHAVGVFLVLSGFGLTYSLAGSGRVSDPKDGWLKWYGRRLVRLFPMYWTAHLVYLISPFVHHRDPVDYRFVLSLMGDRVFPVETMFYYINPSWWFFGLLLELYLVFPILLILLRRLGQARFLILCGLTTLISRFVLLQVLEANGNYIMGAFFGARLWEFAAGMVFAVMYRQSPSQVQEGMSSWRMLWGGVVVYILGVYSYQPGITYIFSDALFCGGMFMIIGYLSRRISTLPLVGSTLSLVGAYSYGLYLLHHPYVIFAGQWLRGAGMLSFLIFATGIITAISLAAIPLEWYVNRLTSRVLDGPRPARLAAPQA